MTRVAISKLRYNNIMLMYCFSLLHTQIVTSGSVSMIIIIIMVLNKVAKVSNATVHSGAGLNGTSLYEITISVRTQTKICFLTSPKINIQRYLAIFRCPSKFNSR